MLTPEQLDEFRRFGIVRVPGAISPRAANAMCDSVWAMMARRYHIRRDDPETWKAQRIAGFKDRPRAITFEHVATPEGRAIFDELLGTKAWERSENWGSLLVSFPGAYPPARDGRWDVPHQNWHLDAPVVRSLPNLYGLRVFTCLAKVAPGGGATLAVAGSPRLAQELAGARGMAKVRSADVRKGLIQRYRWMKDLCSFDASVDRVQLFMNAATTLDAVEVRVIEMTGEPGDTYLMHPLMMHAASPNCLALPRMVLSTTVYQRDIDWSVLYGPEGEAAA
jgi:Phytanoyl-CoA dioxygenase (PhyH)